MSSGTHRFRNESWMQLADRIAKLEAEVERLRKGDECHIAHPDGGNAVSGFLTLTFYATTADDQKSYFAGEIQQEPQAFYLSSPGIYGKEFRVVDGLLHQVATDMTRDDITRILDNNMQNSQGVYGTPSSPVTVVVLPRNRGE